MGGEPFLAFDMIKEAVEYTQYVASGFSSHHPLLKQSTLSDVSGLNDCAEPCLTEYFSTSGYNRVEPYFHNPAVLIGGIKQGVLESEPDEGLGCNKKLPLSPELYLHN